MDTCPDLTIPLDLLPGPEGNNGSLSPLSGAYLLVVLAKPTTESHKKKILQKLHQGRDKNVHLTFFGFSMHLTKHNHEDTLFDCFLAGNLFIIFIFVATLGQRLPELSGLINSARIQTPNPQPDAMTIRPRRPLDRER